MGENPRIEWASLAVRERELLMLLAKYGDGDGGRHNFPFVPHPSGQGLFCANGSRAFQGPFYHEDFDHLEQQGLIKTVLRPDKARVIRLTDDGIQLVAFAQHDSTIRRELAVPGATAGPEALRIAPEAGTAKRKGPGAPVAKKDPASKDRKGDPTLLGGLPAVNFRVAEEYLGIGERQRQNLIRKGSLEVVGGGSNRKILTASLKRYAGPENPQ